MKTCLSCGSANRDEAKFCLSCGVRLVHAPPGLSPSLPAIQTAPVLTEASQVKPDASAPGRPESWSEVRSVSAMTTAISMQPAPFEVGIPPSNMDSLPDQLEPSEIGTPVAGGKEQVGQGADDSGNPSVMSSMVYCGICMAKNDASSDFCESCGYVLRTVAAAPVVVEPEESSLHSGVTLQHESATMAPGELPLPFRAAREPGLMALESKVIPVSFVAVSEPQPLGPELEPSSMPVIVVPVVSGQSDEPRSAPVTDLTVESADTKGVLCPSCATVLRFCPCCGKPLSTSHPRSGDRGV